MRRVASKEFATVNFASDKLDGGTFSSWSPERVQQNLRPLDLEAINIRDLNSAPTLDREGFALTAHDIDGDWLSNEWLDDVYVPTCLDLVQRLSGAKVAINMYFPILRSTAGLETAAPAARFIHFDQPRQEYAAQAKVKAASCGYSMGRAAVFNVWKPISRPPQSAPLALCDQRDIAVEDHVRGVTVENDAEAPYIGLAAPSAPYPIYYAPDMAISESIVFLAANFDPAAPLGVPHTAITPPGGSDGLVPRSSVELRVLALFD